MTVKIVNMVVTADLKTDLNLEELTETLATAGKVYYEPERFPGLVFKTKSKISMLLFRTGKIVIAGARNLEEIKNAVKMLVRTLRTRIGNIPDSIQVQIQNIVATGELNRQVDLEGLSRILPNVLYEPEQFPGLIYRPDFGKPVILIFSTGKVVLVGGRTEEDIAKAFEELKRIVEENTFESVEA
jgi:transcription initiation factor TFIID TATA-box-binding protein